jgi:hypothetical protein
MGLRVRTHFPPSATTATIVPLVLLVGDGDDAAGAADGAPADEDAAAADDDDDDDDDDELLAMPRAGTCAPPGRTWMRATATGANAAADAARKMEREDDAAADEKEPARERGAREWRAAANSMAAIGRRCIARRGGGLCARERERKKGRGGEKVGREKRGRLAQTFSLLLQLFFFSSSAARAPPAATTSRRGIGPASVYYLPSAEGPFAPRCRRAQRPRQTPPDSVCVRARTRAELTSALFDKKK